MDNIYCLIDKYFTEYVELLKNKEFYSKEKRKAIILEKTIGLLTFQGLVENADYVTNKIRLNNLSSNIIYELINNIDVENNLYTISLITFCNVAKLISKLPDNSILKDRIVQLKNIRYNV